jgi:transcriptional regulator
MQGIVGFSVEVTRLEASNKLSQNRNDEDYANIIRELENRSEPKSQQIASAMREKRKPTV